MNDSTPMRDMISESSIKGKDRPSRRLLIILLALWLVTVGILLAVSWNAYFKKKEAAKTLAQQIHFACSSGDFGPGLSKANQDLLCNNAEKVIKNQDPTPGIQGPPGPRGPQGVQGIQGPPGLQGLMGIMGKSGKDGTTGPPGPAGPAGLNGKDGIDGKNGTDGKDGLPGPPGVVQVTTIGCEGPVIKSITASYDATSQTVAITCNQ